jgi:hypothetical protein
MKLAGAAHLFLLVADIAADDVANEVPEARLRHLALRASTRRICMSVLSFVLAAMTTLAPGRDHADLGGAIARIVDAERPLFERDVDHRRTAALIVAVAFRESTFDAEAVGDHGNSFCALQIHRSSGGTPALLTNRDACVREGLRMLRLSLKICPAHPVAWYASGPLGCENARAQRISRDRMAIAARLYAQVQVM